MLVFCMSSVYQLLNKRIYDDDDASYHWIAAVVIAPLHVLFRPPPLDPVD